MSILQKRIEKNSLISYAHQAQRQRLNAVALRKLKFIAKQGKNW